MGIEYWLGGQIDGRVVNAADGSDQRRSLFGGNDKKAI